MPDRLSAFLAATTTQPLQAAIALPSFERLIPISGDICHEGLGLDITDRERLLRNVDVVIHAAARTRFTAPRLISMIRTCTGLDTCSSSPAVVTTSDSSFSSVRCAYPGPQPARSPRGWRMSRASSSTCTNAPNGRRNASRRRPNCRCGLPELSTCVGSERTGYVHRSAFCAIHQLLYWLTRGLLPVVPALEGSRIDLPRDSTWQRAGSLRSRAGGGWPGGV